MPLTKSAHRTAIALETLLRSQLEALMLLDCEDDATAGLIAACVDRVDQSLNDARLMLSGLEKYEAAVSARTGRCQNSLRYR